MLARIEAAALEWERERALGEAQELARRRGPKWSEADELGYVVAISDFQEIPPGFVWQYRKWENGAPLYSWGQIQRASSCRVLFQPSLQQPAQAAKLLGRSYFWWALTDSGARGTALRIWAAHQKAESSGVRHADMALPDPRVLTEGSAALRKSLVDFTVNEGWLARAGRKDQARAVLQGWEAWINEGGKP